jgi:hypothetical protein
MGYHVVSPMHDDFIREHIKATSARGDQHARTVIARLAVACWPGGTADRTEPGALAWVRSWRPATSAGRLPVCSCAAGRCTVCN